MHIRALIAMGVVGATTVLFVLAEALNAFTQVRHNGVYTVPPDLMEIFKMIFGASVGMLTFGISHETRKVITKRKDETKTEITIKAHNDGESDE